MIDKADDVYIADGYIKKTIKDVVFFAYKTLFEVTWFYIMS